MIFVVGALLAALTQPAPPPVGGPVDTLAASSLTIYLVTFEPGPLIWERFGHNALWVRDTATGSDVAYDYGRFSFGRTTADQFRFFGRFAMGDLNYSMGYAKAEDVLDGYARLGRAIWVQELDLPAAARVQLRDFLEWNKTEDHKYYQYNYYLDNCSTRLRDAIDRVIGGQIKAWADTLQTPWTFRDHTKRTTESDPAMFTILDIALGQPTDKRVTAWEEMFLPISLRPYLNAISIRDPDGRVHPLVKTQRQLVESDRYRVADRPTNWLGRYLLLGLGLGGLLVVLGKLGARSRRWRFGFALTAGFWSIAAGVGGLLLAFLWAFTTHRFAYRNENLFQLNVASLILAAVIPKGVFSADPVRRVRVLFVARLVMVISAVGLLLKVFPGFHQANLELIALFLPIHLGLLAGLTLTQAGDQISPPGAV